MHHPLFVFQGGKYLSSEELHGKSRLDDFTLLLSATCLAN